jgi:hypothetical protein
MSVNARRLLASVAFACGATLATQASAAITVQVLSSMPQLVTGGDALVRISGATAAPSVTVGGADVSAAFKADGGGNWIGLVTGLRDGDNALMARAGADQATVNLRSHPVNGTLFAGPQQSPFLCENESFQLDPAKDASCGAPTTVKYLYRDKANAWKPFDPAGARPGDIATTKTTDGKEVPVIVRQERGVINRAAYVLTLLHDPAAGPAPSPQSRGSSGWNGKLVYGFGGGVGPGFHMGRSVGIGNADRNWIDDRLINGGYATAGSSINVFGNQPSDLLSAETAAKVKERFVEQYGVPLFTIGQGGSGGSMQQQAINNAYPGILDGIQPSALFADVITFLQPLYDCELLVNVFKQGTWTRAQLNAVSGKYWGFCPSNATRYPRARVSDNCDAAVTAWIDKDPVLKAQKPIRCTLQDNLVNVFGVDQRTGNARNPFDNVGVQYGLAALNAGVISWPQFLDINQRIGGHDADGKIGPNRQVGDEQALKAAYQTGRINLTAGGNRNVPIVDIRGYNDGDLQNRGDANINVHDGYHSLIVQARLQKYNGNLNNYVWLLSAQTLDTGATVTPGSQGTADGLAIIDKWLTAIMNDKSNRPPAEKVAANRPAEAVDTCYVAKAGPLFGQIEKITDKAKCREIFPMYTDPRIAAGGPMTADVLKCQLKPIAAADYKVAPNADQLAQLQRIFPGGVCDWSKPGVGQTEKVTTWAVFRGDGTFVGL